jgi:hypothetical protein
MKVKVHDTKIEIMSVKRDKKRGDFTMESHAEVTLFSDKDGDYFWVDLGERRYRLVNSKGCLLVEEDGVVILKPKKKAVK